LCFYTDHVINIGRHEEEGIIPNSMRCPYCLNTKTRVLDKRDIVELDVIRRRRECLKCHKRFTTYERIELVGFSVVKKDGKRESFNRAKLITGLLKACEKRPIPRESVEKMVNEIEAELKNYEEREVASSVIGQIVMDKLKSLDRVAYIRFASVYRDFQDIQSFEKELRALKRSDKK
jgi:transcriptional repressor NrdR